MADHIRKAHPDHIALRGIDVRYFGEMLSLVKTAVKARVIPMLPMQMMWMLRMEKLANRMEIIDIENEPELPRLEPEPEVLPALDVEAEQIIAFEDDGGYTGPIHD